MAIVQKQVTLGDFAAQQAAFDVIAFPGSYSPEVGLTSNAYGTYDSKTGQARPYTAADIISQGGGDPNKIISVPTGGDFLANYGAYLFLAPAAAIVAGAAAAGAGAAAASEGSVAASTAATTAAETGSDYLATGGLIVSPEEAATSGAVFSTGAEAGAGSLTLSDVLSTGKAASTVLGGVATAEGLLAPKPAAKPAASGTAQPYMGLTIFPPGSGLGDGNFSTGGISAPSSSFTSSATMIGLGVLVALLLAVFFKG